MDIETQVAKALLKIGAVKFDPKNPITFKSGIKSPVYVDNRKLPFHPTEWKIVLDGFKALVEKNKIHFDIVAGVEAAGIPHSAALGYAMQMPSVFIRKQAKDHGTKKLVEGGEVNGKKVLLLEDLVSTGLSSLAAVGSLRTEGAMVENCLVIVSYGFPETKKAFIDAQVNLVALTSFPVILQTAVETGTLSQAAADSISEWFTDPHGWATKNNF